MPVAIDKKEILPCFALAWAGFDFGHVYTKPPEGSQCPVQRPDPVHDAKHNAGAVFPGGRTALTAKHKEACGIGSIILNVKFKHANIILLSRQHTRDSSRFFLFGREFSRA